MGRWSGLKLPWGFLRVSAWVAVDSISWAGIIWIIYYFHAALRLRRAAIAPVAFSVANRQPATSSPAATARATYWAAGPAD